MALAEWMGRSMQVWPYAHGAQVLLRITRGRREPSQSAEARMAHLCLLSWKVGCALFSSRHFPVPPTFNNPKE